MVYYNLATDSFYHGSIPVAVPNGSDIRVITDDAYSKIASSGGTYYVDTDLVGIGDTITAEMLSEKLTQ